MTKKETAVLKFIVSEAKKSMNTPTYREIQDHFGFASLHSVTQYIEQLSKQEYLTHLPKRGYGVNMEKVEELDLS